MESAEQSAAFLCYFLGKNSALRFFIHLLEKSLMINNMLIRVYKKCCIFLYHLLYFRSQCLVDKYTKLDNLVKIEELVDLKSSLYL